MASPWTTLESNPDVLNEYLHELGVDKNWGLMDIFSLHPENAGFVSQPCLAVILTLPVTEKYSDQLQNEVTDPTSTVSPIYFIKQTIPNSCGTIALIHAVANNMICLNLDDENSVISRFLAESQNLSPEDRGKKLEEHLEIAYLHAAAAQSQPQEPEEGVSNQEIDEAGAQDIQSQEIDADGAQDVQSQPQEPLEEESYEAAAVNEDPFHYIVFVKIDDHVVELDGLRDFPLVHGETTDADFVADVFRVIQTYIDQAPDERYSALSFGLMDF